MTPSEPAATPSTAAPQRDSPDTPNTPGAHLPGDGHMWVMVLGDMIIFGGYFIIYMIYRAKAPAEYLAAQQHLNLAIGMLNTVVLLTSSWFIARSVLAVRAGRHDQAIRLTYAGGLCGVVFIIVKAYEWSTKLLGGQTNSVEFYSFYYVLTGVHLLHVAIGLVVLGVVVRELRSPSRRRVTMVESGAIYWHMVDLLWVVIFALLYVMR